MITWNELTSIAVLSVYLGFSGMWGSLLSTARKDRLWLAVSFGLLLVLPASILLPWKTPVSAAAWLLSLLAIGLFTIKPQRMPGWLWKPSFAHGYFSVVMFLIVIWAILSGQFWNWLWVGIPAGMAGMLALRRMLIGDK